MKRNFIKHYFLTNPTQNSTDKELITIPLMKKCHNMTRTFQLGKQTPANTRNSEFKCFIKIRMLFKNTNSNCKQSKYVITAVIFYLFSSKSLHSIAFHRTRTILLMIKIFNSYAESSFAFLVFSKINNRLYFSQNSTSRCLSSVFNQKNLTVKY